MLNFVLLRPGFKFLRALTVANIVKNLAPAARISRGLTGHDGEVWYIGIRNRKGKGRTGECFGL